MPNGVMPRNEASLARAREDAARRDSSLALGMTRMERVE
jgi:hypothetical protein